MLIDNEIYKQDVDSILRSKMINWDRLIDKTIFVTGATGLIGALVVSTLLQANRKFALNCRVIAGVRNREKALLYLGNESTMLSYYISDITEPVNISEKINYIIHTASQTGSKGFINQPVETIDITLNGIRNVLDLARTKKAEKMVFLSTMEIYGAPDNDRKITERSGTNLFAGDVRSCYPISKIMAENLCASFASEYDVNSSVLVLTQTFGPGVKYNDGRVFAEFARAAIEGNDIILHTKGMTKRSYLYTADAVRAILQVLLDGKQEFDIYNVANEDTYCSIYEMAEIFCTHSFGEKISVKVEIKDISQYGYAPTLHMNLDTKKIRECGWTPEYNLDVMIENLIKYMSSEKNNVGENGL